MKIIIADDESLIRSSLISMLGELEIPVEVAGEARNGEELIRMVAQDPPDLAFVDIQMPKLNGLEAIAQVKDTAPGTQWILLTGFSDFEYAKRALRLGAINYMLKPVSPEQLAEAVSEAEDRCRLRYEGESRQFEHLLLSLIHSGRPDEAATVLALPEGMRGYRFMAAVCPPAAQGRSQPEREILAEALRKAASSVPLCRDVRFAATALPGGEFGNFLAWDPGEQGEATRSAYQRRLEDEVTAALDGLQLPVSILQTGVCESLTELVAQLGTMERLAPLLSVVPLGAVAKLSELQHADRNGSLLPLGQQVERLGPPYINRDLLQYSKEHKQLKKLFSPDLFRIPRTVQAMSAYLRRAIGFVPGQNAEGNREAWFAELLSHGERTLTKRSGEDRLQGDWVEQVIRYVDRSYMNDIGIGQIAVELSVTPNYLSSLFHKKKGVTFVKYLTETRMLKAKELLLANRSMKIQTIAEAVGYHSVRHFTKTFTDYFDCYPSELRDKYE